MLEVSALPPNIRSRLDEVVAGELPLPILPEVAAQVLAMVDDENCDARVLTDLVRSDPALAAHAMRVASSPMYASTVKMVSLQQVIARLGFSIVTQIALAVATRARTFRAPGFETELRAVFAHSLTCALFAQEIARKRKRAVDEAFMAGLLHDLGRPVLLQVIVDLYREAKLVPDRDAILATIDLEHPAIGATIATAWSLPVSVAEAIRRHHAPIGSELATVVALADSFAHDRAHDPTLAVALDLYPADLQPITKRRGDIAQTVEALA